MLGEARTHQRGRLERGAGYEKSRERAAGRSLPTVSERTSAGCGSQNRSAEADFVRPVTVGVVTDIPEMSQMRAANRTCHRIGEI